MLLRNGFIAPDRLVWLGKTAGLDGVSLDANRDLRLGAQTTLAAIARDRLVRAHCPSLAFAASRAANPRVRAVATLGGHLAHADPRQDLPPVLLALDARVTIAGLSTSRTIGVDELLVDFMTTSLASDEIIVSVTVPARPGRRERYVRFTPNSLDDYPTVGVAAVLEVDADGTVTDARIGLGGVAPSAVLVEAARPVLVGRRPSAADLDALADAARETASPVDDQRGSAAYKKAMSALWAKRTVAALLEPEPGD